MDRVKKVSFRNVDDKSTEQQSELWSEQRTESVQFNPVAEDGRINVHPHTHAPNRVWNSLKVKQDVKNRKPLSRKTQLNPNKVRFVCISDTHNKTLTLPESIPDGDVLLHAGDFTMVGQPQQVEEFNEFLGKLPHRRKVVIAGNHDLTFDKNFVEEDALLSRFGLKSKKVKEYLRQNQIQQMSEVLTNCTDYLEDSSVEIYGIKIYGSPWQPWFGGWGFNLERGQECLEKWNMIPTDTDVLMTHGPPLGHGDYCSSGQRAGCVELLNTIQHRVKPKFHVFGHIHEGYGMTTDGTTNYINASTCTLRYKPTNPPIIFDMPLPDGHQKEGSLCEADTSSHAGNIDHEANEDGGACGS